MISTELNSLLDQLNSAQREAVTTVEGPVLVVAGAGSGKTRVITYRIPYLLMTGAARSENILALTFTNKAAGEMKSRVSALSGFSAPHISTFHSFGALFLRRHISLAGYSSGFLIYDEDDQLAILKECLEDLQRDSRYNARDIQYFLKWQKSRSAPPEIFDPNVQLILNRYEQKLRNANAVDFEDLLTLPLKILRDHQHVRNRYEETYQFLMVDEYQDTNEIQYELLKVLAGARANLLVVGDEDQSIYKFRGARSENLQHFLRDFPQTRIIKLEQNYRSTKTIIKAAQAVISNNSTRLKKELWTENAAGEPMEVYHAFDEYDEATFVTLRVLAALKESSAKEIAVLYRANAQSRAFEESFGKAQIPHRIVGGVGFYERREIRDAIAYLRLLVNRNDPLSFYRVINVPPRGVGKKMLERIQAEADTQKISLFDAAARIGGKSLSSFLDLFERLPEKPSIYMDDLLTRIGYFDYLRKDDPLTAEDRMENISEFLAFLRENEASPEFDLTVFLSELPLQSRAEQGADGVTLLTVHSAKGLEFQHLFVVGLEEGLFPHIRSLDKAEDVEEERRLFYVAMTRAKQKLTLSWAQRRGMFGNNMSNRPSRFLDEIPGWFKVNRISERFGSPAVAATTRGVEEPQEFRSGSVVSHAKFGRGTVVKVEGVKNDWKLTIRFNDGVKTILTRYAQITLLSR
jgi:DNA helicase-2/ATP-dependent DNA helicase PcrA